MLQTPADRILARYADENFMRDVALRAVAVAPDAIFTLPKPALPEAEKKEAATKKGKKKGNVREG